MKRKRRIAPRLASGIRRESCGHGLPPHIKKGLQMVAYERGESLSWTLEKALIDRFQLEKPEYVPVKRG